MRVMQYVTTQGFQLRPYELFPCGSTPTASKEIRVDESTAFDGLIGFGVALTGSSCYELATLPPEKRRALLHEIYSPEGLGLSVARLTMGSSDDRCLTGRNGYMPFSSLSFFLGRGAPVRTLAQLLNADAVAGLELPAEGRMVVVADRLHKLLALYLF